MEDHPLDRPGRYTAPKVIDEPAVSLSAYPGTIRQLIVKGLGRDTPPSSSPTLATPKPNISSNATPGA
jgi:hypothetical protein